MQTANNTEEHQTMITASNPEQTASQTASTPEKTAPSAAGGKGCGANKFYFVYRGKERKLYRRGTGPTAKWYLYMEHKKERINHCCGSVAKEAAIKTAKIKVDAVLDGFTETLRASMLRDPEVKPELVYATVQEIITAFEWEPKEMGEQTERTNVNCLRLVLRRALDVEDVDKLSSAAVFTADTAERYFSNAIRRSKLESDQEGAARLKRSANSIFNQGKSLLRPKMLAAYRRAGLTLPDVEPFMNAYKEQKFAGVTALYDPPTEEIIRRTLRGWLRMTDHNMFIAVGLELACGLRKAEVQQVTWGMFTKTRHGALLDGRGAVKNQSGRFVVPPINPFWKHLNRRIEREGWRGQPDELVLQGTATDLADNIFRSVGLWLRSLGWETQKTNHALRAYSGSLVAMREGIWRASAWLRHASVKTTESFYMHFMNERVFKPEEVRISFA